MNGFVIIGHRYSVKLKAPFEFKPVPIMKPKRTSFSSNNALTTRRCSSNGWRWTCNRILYYYYYYNIMLTASLVFLSLLGAPASRGSHVTARESTRPQS